MMGATVIEQDEKAHILYVLKELRAQKSAEDIAQLVGRNPMTVRRWLQGKFTMEEMPLKSYRAIMRAAQDLGIPLALGERSRWGASREEGDAERGLIPVYQGTGRELAGFFNDLGYPLPAAEPVNHVARPPDLIDERWAYGVRMSDESMSPKIEPGATAIVAPSRQAREGNVVVARLRTHEVVVRRYTRRDGQIVLTAINPAFGELVLNQEYVEWMRPVVWIREAA